MATFTYKFPQLAYDSYTREPARWREDGKLLDENGVEVQTTDLNGVPGPLRTGSTGIIAPFMAPVDIGTAVFGEAAPTLIISDDWLMLRAQVDDIVASAHTAVADANAALSIATPVSWMGRDPDGRLWVSDVPIEEGGGRPVYDASGRLYFVFPTVLPAT